MILYENVKKKLQKLKMMITLHVILQSADQSVIKL
jgi:hypothetical protein